MNVVIKRTTDSEAAIKIAEKLHGTYFDDQGMQGIVRDTSEREFFGAFDNEQVGFLTFNRIYSIGDN